jgi:hypothetical protein
MARARTTFGRLQGIEHFPEKTDVPTETPPPYFPQNPLSPGDEKTARRVRLTFYGCALLLLLGIVAVVVGLVQLVRSLL